MRSFTALFLALLATVASVASSPLTVALRRFRGTRVCPGEKIRARAGPAESRRDNEPTTVPITNNAVFYAASIGVGSPATYYNLAIDTGSSNLLVGLRQPYNRTPTSFPTGEHVNVVYAIDVSVSGVEYLDRVTLAPNLVVTNQSIGDVFSSVGLSQFGFDGILGLGPVDLTKGTLSPDENAMIPTVMNNLVAQGLIDKQIFSTYFAPAENDSDTNGFLTFGGVNPSLYVGELTYVPLTSTSLSSRYWGFNITRCTYGDRTIISHSTAGIMAIPSPTLIATELFDIYKDGIPGATYNTTISLLEIPAASIPSMKSLHFQIGGKEFTLDVAAQLIPQAQNTAWGGEPDKHYSIISDLGIYASPGLGFVLGMGFMERFYMVFDADARRIGLAKTKHTFTPDRKPVVH